ncbi:MAG: branched-chain amino acid ABC transporter permease, partial [Betaproteobacteria bacterium]|nr:branched-chain amino acid ABC transporter permease [Betaproteobacteria bacterium]
LLGVVYVLIVMYVPGGLVAGASRLARRLRRGGGRAQPAAQELAEATPGSPGDSTAAGGRAS